MPDPLLDIALRAALAGGEAAMRVYADPFEVTHKDDKTPVTEDDRHTRRRIYRIADNFLAFWLGVLDRYRAEIDGGLGDTIVPVLMRGLDEVGIRVLHGRPRHPQTQGKEERFHRTLKAEVVSGRSFRDLADCQRAFDDWRPRYNHERPHEALDQCPPANLYTPSPRAYPDRLP